MKINFVMGLCHTGKSTFIHEVKQTDDLFIDVLAVQALFQLKTQETGEVEAAAQMTAQRANTADAEQMASQRANN